MIVEFVYSQRSEWIIGRNSQAQLKLDKRPDAGEHHCNSRMESERENFSVAIKVIKNLLFYLYAYSILHLYMFLLVYNYV